MNAPFWVTELAAAFWDEAGEPAPFPRDLRPVIVSTLPLSMVELPALTVGAVRAWLIRRGLPWCVAASDRPLHACLVVRDDGGIVFLEAGDAEDERRFSLAHETAHFLRHYRQPRQRAASRLGDDALEVLDGKRPPRMEERLHALLAGVPLGFHLHLLGRDDGHRPASAALATAEREADRLAWELLAPVAEIASRVGVAPDRARLVRLLLDDFGLPLAAAQGYAAVLTPMPVVDPILQRLRRKI